MTKDKHKRRRQPSSPKPSVNSTPLEKTPHPLTRVIPYWPVILAVLIAAVPFVAGKYMEILRDGPYDGGANAYAAQAIVNGAKIGQDIYPSARPATLLVNVIGVAIFGYSELGPKIIQMLMQITALTLLFYTLRKIYGNLPAAIGLICASLFLSYPFFAKYGNVKEQYMIACMVVAACALVLRHIGHRWYWLLISGAAAINIVYFKPTGASVIIAMAVYLIAQPIFKHRSLKQTAHDILLLLAGAVIGILPLLIFYAQQGRLDTLYHATPGLKALSALFPAQEPATSNADAPTDYLSGSRLVTNLAEQSQSVMQYYHRLITPIALALVAVFWRLMLFIIPWAKRILPNHSSAAPKINTAPKQSSPTPSSAAPNPDHFIILFAIWWILDMLFIWISPRSYVEYFLPLNASAAMLAAYTIYRIQRQPLGVPVLLLVCILCNTVTATFINKESTIVPKWPTGCFIPIILAILVTVIFTLLRTPRLRKTLLLLVVLINLLIWPMPVINHFSSLVSELHSSRQSAHQLATQLNQTQSANEQNQIAYENNLASWFRPNPNIANAWHQAIITSLQEDASHTSWQIAGHFIRQNSQHTDGIYVWGWFPGIYVTAQRFCPSPRPSESNMHTHSPTTLAASINQLVQDFTANPPRYIVDTQKMHFPYYSHPVFDLWPRIQRNEQQQIIGFNLRMIPGQPQGENLSYMSSQDLDRYSENIWQQVFQFTYFYLTREDHTGGPLPPDQAQQRAEQETQRHQAMSPLRRFVMEHYRPLLTPYSDIFIFEYIPESQ